MLLFSMQYFPIIIFLGLFDAYVTPRAAFNHKSNSAYLHKHNHNTNWKSTIRNFSWFWIELHVTVRYHILNKKFIVIRSVGNMLNVSFLATWQYDLFGFGCCSQCIVYFAWCVINSNRRRFAYVLRLNAGGLNAFFQINPNKRNDKKRKMYDSNGAFEA